MQTTKDDDSTQKGTHRRTWLRVLIIGLLLYVLGVALVAFTGNSTLFPTVVLLGSFMVPAAFVVLSTIPLTPNGKVDRHALDNIEREELPAATEYQPPESDLEKRLAEFWVDLLAVDRVGLHDDFFQLGGHSLMATQLMSRVREVFGVEVTVRTLFDAPRLGELALYDEIGRRDQGCILYDVL